MEIDFWRPLAGLGLFLFAMNVIEGALEALSGTRFRHFLRHNTHPPLRGVATGTLSTSLLQSSSVVGLMMLALVGAGVLRTRNALAVIFGANLGTTVTGWIVATIGFKLDLDELALPLIALGGVLTIAITNARLRHWARMLFGLGLLLLGLSFMKSAVADAGKLVAPEQLEALNAFQYLLFGIVFSALVQSSSATMMVTLSALHGGIITLPDAAAIAIGADLGTTGTLLLGAIRGTAPKKRVAAGHFLFNLGTESIAFVLRLQLLAVVALLGLSDLLSLVAFHSLFNLVGIAVFLPIIGRFASFLERQFPDHAAARSRHLDPEAAQVPEAATEALALEAGYLLQRVICQNLQVFDPSLVLPPGQLPVGIRSASELIAELPESFKAAYADSKKLEGELLRFAGTAQQLGLDEAQLAAMNRSLGAVRDAVQSSKYLSDIEEDLSSRGGLSSTPPEFLNAFRQAQRGFYAGIMELRQGPDAPVTREGLNALEALAAEQHDALHRQIYGAIQSGVVSRAIVSTLLNVNRLLFNSNEALLAALRTHHHGAASSI